MINEEKSEKIRNIIECKPPLLVRNGNVIIIVIVLILAIISFIIPLPEADQGTIGKYIFACFQEQSGKHL